MSFDLYQEVTDRIIAMLEQGIVPWRSPILGRSSAGHPQHLHSRKPYRGINVFLLAFTAWRQGYGSSYWLTFNQARERGGWVKKGEKSSLVVFWKQLETKDSKTGEDIKVPLLRYYNVFNIEQCDGITAPDAVAFEPLDFKPIEAAQSIVNSYADGPNLKHGGPQAFYSPRADTVRMPAVSRFVSSEAYYATLFHELAHSTGHSKRLDRGLDTDLQPFGSPDYGREELVAETAAAFLSARAGVSTDTIESSAAYIQSWTKQLKSDKRLVVTAAGAALKAADWILCERQK